MARSKTILVTGGAGFIGSHLAEALLARNDRVVVLDNFDPFYEESIKRRYIQKAQKSSDYRLVEGDIRDSDTLERLFAEKSFDAVIHLAARAGVRPSIEDPVEYCSVNVDGTSKLLEACRNHRVETFVFGSSSSVYGNNRKVPFAEDDPVDRPISPYAATKKAGEVICHTYHHLYGMKIACLRFFTVYGPRQRPEMAIHKFVRKIFNEETLDQYGDGGSARDYTFVADIVRGIVAAMERASSYHIWNLGGSECLKLSELIAAIASEVGKPAKIRQLPLQAGDVDQTWADITRAREELDWKAETTHGEGLKQFISWYREHAGVGRSE
ncbi:MAG: GDP-mannose 4,6-dehydratase [Acidobacteriota bacterium]|nr:GDP-mannose 4,6-dehydratase [Acidobacteriota bacterium]MDH3784082.1 GDP-mannose 4,6-dehydratase [Acidobacteriota bacterium]